MSQSRSFLPYLFYGLPALPLALLGLPLYVYLPTFYTQDLGIDIFTVGLVLLFARLLDMFLDPLIGYLSDHFFSRKVYIFCGMLCLLFGFYFLTHPPLDVGFMWLLFFSMCVYFGWSLMSVPYYALGADLTQSYSENTKYASYRELFNITGVLLALSIPYLFGVADVPRESLLLMNTTVFFLLPPLLLLFLYTIKPKAQKRYTHRFKEVLQKFFAALKRSRTLFSAFFFNSFANALPATLFLFYIELVIGAKEYAGNLLLVYFFAGIIALPFWNYIARKSSKKTAWKLSMISAMFFFAFIPILQEGELLFFALITLFSGMSLGADMALPTSMQADIAQNSFGSSQEMGGTLFGFFAMLVKLSLAFGVGVSFALLGLAGFDAAAPTQQSLFALTLLYGALPVLLKLVAYFFLDAYEENRAL
ncbi:MAG: MFS transporter [Sulfurospirillum sp.]|nr:MFS transporter [Sulfurospirillum sp.]